MTIEIYDVAIAGGGPAGSSAAIRLARQGLTVCYIDREKFPRANFGRVHLTRMGQPLRTEQELLKTYRRKKDAR